MTRKGILYLGLEKNMKCAGVFSVALKLSTMPSSLDTFCHAHVSNASSHIGMSNTRSCRRSCKQTTHPEDVEVGGHTKHKRWQQCILDDGWQDNRPRTKGWCMKHNLVWNLDRNEDNSCRHKLVEWVDLLLLLLQRMTNSSRQCFLVGSKFLQSRSASSSFYSKQLPFHHQQCMPLVRLRVRACAFVVLAKAKDKEPRVFSSRSRHLLVGEECCCCCWR